MANYFVDSTTGNDVDSGLTMDLAWATLEKALTVPLNAGDTVWVRRLHSETPVNNIGVSGTGTKASPIRVIGWPRAADASITSADWTNGSTTVDNIVGLSMDREKHVIRWITAPDGQDYLIAYVTDSNTIVIDRAYAGATVSGASGACTIKADEDYDEAQAIDDSGWTITVATWTADADDLAFFGFDTGAYSIQHNNDVCWQYHNIHFKDSANGNGIVYFAYNGGFLVRGCIMENAQGNRTCMYNYLSQVTWERCYIDRTSGNVNVGSLFIGGSAVIKDCVFYSTDGYFLYLSGNTPQIYLENVIFDLAGDAPNEDIFCTYGSSVYGKDVKFGATIGEYERNVATMVQGVDIENFNKVLGSHKKFTGMGEITSTPVVAGSGDPYKRTNGDDTVLEILNDQAASGHNFGEAIRAIIYPCENVFEHEFEATTDKRKYRYYVQAEGAVTADQLWIEVEYVSSYGDATTEYTLTKKVSTQSISARADASDWSQYIEVDNIIPAVASKVRIRCFCNYYHATNKIYIDPLPEVTT